MVAVGPLLHCVWLPLPLYTVSGSLSPSTLCLAPSPPRCSRSLDHEAGEMRRVDQYTYQRPAHLKKNPYGNNGDDVMVTLEHHYIKSMVS